MNNPRSETPRALRLFRSIARLILPAPFVREFGEEIEESIRSSYCRIEPGVRRRSRFRFWLRETLGLVITAWREQLGQIADRRRARRRTHLSTPSRNREMLNTLRNDVLYAFRMIVKSPVVAGIAVLSLAVGVSANTTVFAVLHSWLLRPLPYPDADRIVMVWENYRFNSDDTDGVAPGNYLDWRDEAASFSEWTAQDFETMNLTGIDAPEQLTTSLVTPNFFSMLGATPLHGRTFLPDEGAPGSSKVLVMNERLWRGRFGAEPSVIGKTVTLDGDVYTVVGVVPETFDFLLGTVSAWIATSFEDRRDDRTLHSATVAALLAPGVTVAQAEAEMTAIASRLAERHPETNADWGVNVMTLREQFPGPIDRGLIQVLSAVVFMVLIVACVNIASLLLAKADARQREMAIRVAVGAGKRRLVQQLLTESVVLALIGGALGGILGVWGIAWVSRAIPPEMPATFAPRLDGPVIGFTALVSIVAGLTFGITPAAHAVSGRMREALVDGGRGGTASRQRKRLRSTFVVTEFALALTVLVGAAALTDVFHRRLSIDPGFDPDNLLTMRVILPEHRYDGDSARMRFANELERGLETLPGAETFALSSTMPRSEDLGFTQFTVDGEDYQENEVPRTSWLVVNSTYFETMRIALREGRVFTPADRADEPPVVLVNQRMVDQFFDQQTPVGERITVFGESREIVGVVHNIVQQRLTGVQPFEPAVYLPMAQRPLSGMSIIVRVNGDPLTLAVPVQETVWSLDPEQPISEIETMVQHMRFELAGPYVLTVILFTVGLLALTLAAIGIYGVMAYNVSQQTNEIGVRMALGAKPRQVLSGIAGQGATLAGIGLLLGVPAAFLVIRLIDGVLAALANEGLDGVGGISPGPVIAVSLLLAAVGLIACFVPAVRATRIDPAAALQYE